MKGKFDVLVNGEMKSYTEYDDIPKSFDNLIRCDFDYPEGPHTEEQHEEIGKYNDALQELMRREVK